MYVVLLCSDPVPTVTGQIYIPAIVTHQPNVSVTQCNGRNQVTSLSVVGKTGSSDLPVSFSCLTPRSHLIDSQSDFKL